MTIAEASQALEAALTALPGVRGYRLGGNVDPPAFAIGPPALEWANYCGAPTTATFSVFYMVAADDRAVERLWEAAAPVAEAIDSVPDAITRSSSPGIYSAGSTDLPCYVFTVEVSL